MFVPARRPATKSTVANDHVSIGEPNLVVTCTQRVGITLLETEPFCTRSPSAKIIDSEWMCSTDHVPDGVSVWE